MRQGQVGGELSGNHLANPKIIMSGIGITEINELYEPIERPRIERREEVHVRGILLTSLDELSGAEPIVEQEQIAAEVAEMQADIDARESGGGLSVAEQKPAVVELEVVESEAVNWLRRKGLDFAKSMSRRHSDRVVRANRDDGIHLPRGGERGVPVKEKAKDRWPRMPRRTTAKERRAAEQALVRHNIKKKRRTKPETPRQTDSDSALAYA